jgi:Sulfotransferase family
MRPMSTPRTLATESRASTQQVVFIISPTARCGTNFLQAALAEIGRAEPCRIPEDWLLYEAGLLFRYADRLAERWSQWLGSDEIAREREALLRSLGAGMLRSFTAGTTEGSWTVFKTPSVKNIWNFRRLFGGAKLILLIRDGRDVEESWRNAFPETSIEQVRDWWIEGSRHMLDYMARNRAEQDRRWSLVRYEDLVSTPHDTLERILAFLDIKHPSIDLDLINDLPVLGSSFLPRSSDGWKWEIAPQGEWFRPIERWRSWLAERQQEFIAIAGPELRGFGYQTSES